MTQSNSRFEKNLNAKIRRRIKAKSCPSAACSFALFGLVGWSIVIPAFFAAMLGRWLDDKYGSGTSSAFTLLFIVLGIAVGAVNACRYITRELEK